jgi:lipid-A-disaccharide synthase-like uncharacterized protein
MSWMHEPLANWGGVVVHPWKVIGWTGALMFSARWLVQMIWSRRAGRPVFPIGYWWMSVAGSLMTLAYFIWGKNDSVGVLQNLFPGAVATYNLCLEIRHRRAMRADPS